MIGTGACKWCGQERIIDVDTGEETEAGIVQEELDRAATWECGCQMARAEKDRAERLLLIQDYMDEEFGGNEETHEAMMAAVKAVMRGKVKKATLEAGEKTYTIKKSSDMIEIGWTRTEKESVEY